MLSHIRMFLNAGAFLLLTTGCRGGILPLELVNLWAVSTVGCGRLPEVREMLDQLNDAGYIGNRSINLIPGDKYFAFIGYQKEAQQNGLRLKKKVKEPAMLVLPDRLHSKRAGSGGFKHVSRSLKTEEY